MADQYRPTDFLKFIGTEVEPYILPIIPGDAVLSPSSSLQAGELGKIPGKLTDDGWVGFRHWTATRATGTMLQRWQGWQEKGGLVIPAGLNAINFPMVDGDTDDPDKAMFLEAIAREHLGDTPVVRCRYGSVRRVLVYRHEDHTPPITKQPWKFADKGMEHLIELLGSGQHAVIEGPHAKSGQMHYWLDGGLIDHLGHIPLINVTKVQAFFRALHEWGDAEGYITVKGKLPGAGGERGEGISISDLMSPHLTRDMGMLTAALQHINLDDPQIDYDTFINLLRATCAAVGGDLNYMAEVVWPWVCKNQTIARGDGPRTEERGIEWLEERWRSFHDSRIGADYVFTWAASFGFTDGVKAIHQRETAKVEEMFNGVADGVAADSGGAQDDAGGAGPPGANGGGVPPGGGPIPPVDTHWQMAAAFAAQHGATWRYNVDAKQWFGFTGRVWEACDCMHDAVGAVLAQLGLTIYQTAPGPSAEQRFRALQSWGTINSVVRLLQGMPQMVARNSDFDAHPYLLNTPDGIIDLRSGAMSDHDPALLLRYMTIVSPDILACGNYEAACPRFFRVLRNCATGREWFIDAVRAWFAYCLTGELKHQALLFLHGPPGVGKSLIIQVLYELLGTYSFLLEESFFSKNGGEAKRFDMANIVGKRLLFMDETQLGMTWDETRASKGASAKRLSAEIKFGRTIQFDNTAKICIVGNHKPNFVAAETGGLTSRMLLMEAAGVNYRDPANNGTEGLSDIIVAEEGPAILMWALEACVADYCTPGLFNELTVEPREAARQYAQEDSTLHQWGAHEMHEHPDADIDTMEALGAYLDFCKRISGGKAPHIKLSGFKAAMKVAYPSITFANRTKGAFKNRAYIKGFGFQNQEFGDADNVVPLYQPLPAEPAGNTGEK